VVVITGAAGRLGGRLARRLRQDYHVLGIDLRRFPRKPRDVQYLRLDIRRRKAEALFRAGGISAVVHLGVLHDPRREAEKLYGLNLGGTGKVLEYAQRYGVPKIVLLSSADLYGPRADNPQFLTEEATLMAGSTLPHLVQVDLLFQTLFWRAPQIETVILRPVHVVGGVNNAVSTYLRQPTVPTAMGYDPMLQLIHEDDVVDALVAALRPGLRGVFNLAGPGCVPLSRILQALGARSLPLPHPLGKAALRLLWRWGMSRFPPGAVDHLRFPCMVDDTRAREVLGFSPRRSMLETLEHLRSFRDLSGPSTW